MSKTERLGGKIRALRTARKLSQVDLAGKLNISSSYLNLIEHDRRPLTANLLLRLADVLGVDLKAFSSEDDKKLVSELVEVFSDPIFQNFQGSSTDLRELAATSPAASRGIVDLYQHYRSAQTQADTLAAKLFQDQDLARAATRLMPSEEVNELIQRNRNHYPELEHAAEELWRRAQLDLDNLTRPLIRHLEETLKVKLRISRVEADKSAVRRYDPEKRILTLSELLPPRSRKFQLAHQIALIEHSDLLDRLAQHAPLSTNESRVLYRIVLANYFAGAVMMPYALFHTGAETQRYDIELLGHRFRTSFEQTCHRLTTLQRHGTEGVPFHFVRIDIAGNISKWFSASGMRLPRFSGACPRWNLHKAFLTPGAITTQLSQMPDGTTYFDLACTIAKGRGGYRGRHSLHAIGIGTSREHARRLVYTDGWDLDDGGAAVPVGLTCRMCERMDCEQRAFPPLGVTLATNEHTRGISFYTPVR